MMVMNSVLSFRKSYNRLLLLAFCMLLLSHSVVWAIPPVPQVPSFPSIQSTGNTYHVDKDGGSNANPGTEGSPWATIQYGVNQLSAGDTLIVHEAATAYSEEVDVSVAGTSGNWIVIQGATGERPEVEGNRAIEFMSGCEYIHMTNFDIDGGSTGLQPRPGVSNLVFENLNVYGSTYGIYHGVCEEDAGLDDIYYQDINIYNNSNNGVIVYARSQRVVFDSCNSYSNGGDGFGGHNACTGPEQYWGLPVDPLDIMQDFYFVDCKAYSNDGDGFDPAGVVGGKLVFKNCQSYNNGPGQGNGYKVWGPEVWLINCLSYDNEYAGVDLKPQYEMDAYILNCTLVGNNEGRYGGQLRVPISNGDPLEDANIYLYNTIFHTISTPCVEFDHTNQTIVEEDNNYYYSATNSTAINFRNNWNLYKSYTINEMSDGKWRATEGLGENNVSKTQSGDGLSDPGFVDRSKDDYRLDGHSYAIDAGHSGLGITADIVGTVRPHGKEDIGAYEYQNPGLEMRPESPSNLQIKGAD